MVRRVQQADLQASVEGPLHGFGPVAYSPQLELMISGRPHLQEASAFLRARPAGRM